jgi:hypothetical protein
MNDELERIWKEAVMPISRYCAGIRLEGLRKTTIDFIQNSQYPSRDSNQAAPEYNLKALPTEVTCAVGCPERDDATVLYFV